MKRISIILCSASLLFLSLSLWAHMVDLPTMYGARSNALGGAFAAIDHNAEAIGHNPAGLAGVENINFIIDFSSLLLKPKGVVQNSATAATQSLDGTMQFSPVFAFGFGYRINEHMVIGFGSYVPAGLSTKFEAADGEYSAKASIIEFGPSIAFNLPYDFSFGVTYRIGYGRAKMKSGTTFGVAVLDVDFSGVNYTGLQLGVQFKRWEKFHIGAYYRSPVKYHMKKGTVDTIVTTPAVMPVADTNAEAKLSWVDEAGIGFAHKCNDNRILTTVDFGVTFFKKADHLWYQILGSPTAAATNWKNTFFVHSGIEYMATESIPARLGFAYAHPIVPKSHANALFPAPGATYGFGVGSGYTSNDYSVDISYNMILNKGTVAAADIANVPATEAAAPGEYNNTSHVIGMSLSYNL